MTIEAMTKQKRREIVLLFMAEHGLALPLRTIYFNLESRGYSFSEATVRRRLNELRDDGLVEFIDEGNGFWMVTRKGSQVAEYLGST